MPMYQSSIAPVAETSPPIKTEDLDAMFARFTTSLVQALQPQFAASQAPVANRTAPTPARSGPRREECDFCGEVGHFIRDSSQVAIAIAEGKVKRNFEGRVVLPNGIYVPRTIKGTWLRDRINKWHRQNPNQLAVVEVATRNNAVGQQLMLEVNSGDSAVYRLTADERIAALEQEIYNLRSKEVFDGVHMPPRRKTSAPTGPNDAAIKIGPPKKKVPPVASTEATRNVAGPTVPPDVAPIPLPKIHLYKAIPDASYIPPTTRNFGQPTPKPTTPKDRDIAYGTFAPVQDCKIAEDVYTRSMQTPCVTLTQQELLSLCRKSVKRSVTL